MYYMYAITIMCSCSLIDQEEEVLKTVGGINIGVYCCGMKSSLHIS